MRGHPPRVPLIAFPLIGVSAMDPITGGLIAGGMNMIGSIFSSDQSAKNTQAQIANQDYMMKATQDYETTMSNTAYQRASNDMEQAGLNPAAMFGSGSAASTPSVSTPTAPTPQNTSKLGGIGQAAAATVNSALNMKTFDKMTDEIASLRAQQAKTAAETVTEQAKPALVEAETGLKEAQSGTELNRPELVKAETDSQRASAQNTRTDTALKGYDYKPRELKAFEAQAILDMPDWLRDGAIRAGFLGQKANDVVVPFSNSAHAVSRFFPYNRWP